ncbi:MAG: NTP transferase domain-containing protein [Elusimicrobia bacterium]|nr:NTP transferase domain-containing protein [Elusimicrobiota bacterium]
MDIDILILCGGQGSRLSSVSGQKPKSLMPVGERAFMQVIMDEFRREGFEHFILGAGYLAEQIRDYFAGLDYDIVFSEEKRPLGTAGGIKNAEALIKSPSFFAVNGDSLCKTGLRDFYDFHVARGCILSMVLTGSGGGRDTGRVRMDDDGRINSFMEKTSAGISDAFVNAGIYLMKREIFGYIESNKKTSLEYEVIPSLIEKGCYGYVSEGELMDIGTPERYEKINRYFS